MGWQKIGARIKTLRERRGLTQAELAEKAGLSRIYVQKLEAGEKVNPSFAALDQIAGALRVKLVVDLVDRGEA